MSENTKLVINVCRCCLTKKKLCNIYSIRNKKLSISYNDMIKECLSISVSDTDGLPPWICVKCSDKLNSFFRFKNKSIENYNILLEKSKQLMKLEIKNETSEEDNNVDTIRLNNDAVNADDNILNSDNDTEDKPIISTRETNNKNVFPTDYYYESDNFEVKVENDDEEFVVTSATVNDIDEKLERCEKENAVNTSANEDSNLESFNNDLQLLMSKINQKQNFCQLCVKSFSRKKHLIEHVKHDHFGIKYFCEICQKYFKNEHRHKSVHMQKKWKACDECGETFAFKSSYIQHIITKHSMKGIYRCECGESFQNKVLFKKHKYMEHDEKSFICHICPRSFMKKKGLLNHVQTHIEGTVIRNRSVEIKPYEVPSPDNIPIIKDRDRSCTVCKRIFKSNISLMEHVRSAHLGDKYFCEICKKYYQSETQHNKVTHKKPKWAQCDECRMKFKLKRAYDDHMSSVHEVDPHIDRYNCHCGVGFDRIKELRKHKSLMHNEKEFICQYCSKGYVRKYKLQQHLLMHTKEKRFPCLSCPKSFFSNETLIKHRRRHTSGNFVCDHCGKDFKLKLYLRAHITMHDPLYKPHPCAVCGKRFRRSDHRYNHQKLVHKLQPDQGVKC